MPVIGHERLLDGVTGRLDSLIAFCLRLTEQLRDPHAEDLGETVQQRQRRGLQPALDLGQVILGDSRQASDDSLRLALACR
jgi:hypothetical protein